MMIHFREFWVSIIVTLIGKHVEVVNVFLLMPSVAPAEYCVKKGDPNYPDYIKDCNEFPDSQKVRNGKRFSLYHLFIETNRINYKQNVRLILKHYRYKE